jgi:hypothetical protein
MEATTTTTTTSSWRPDCAECRWTLTIVTKPTCFLKASSLATILAWKGGTRFVTQIRKPSDNEHVVFVVGSEADRQQIIDDHCEIVRACDDVESLRVGIATRLATNTNCLHVSAREKENTGDGWHCATCGEFQLGNYYT